MSDPVTDLATLLRTGGSMRCWYVPETRSYVVEHIAPDATRTIAMAPFCLEDAMRACVERIDQVRADTDRPEASPAALLAGAEPIGGGR